MVKRIGLLAAITVVLATVQGCGKSEGTGASAGNGSAGAGAPAGGNSTAGKAGYAVGQLTEEGGAVIKAAEAKLVVSLWGVSSKSGEKVYYTPKVNADGTYEQKLVEGTYKFDGAKIEVPFKGKHFWFDLEAVGDDKSDRDSDKPIVQNYVWKTHGLRPGHDADESNFTNWYGASVNMQFDGYREDIKKPAPKGNKGSKCVFTLTPQGPHIDGHEGKEMTFTREWDPLLGGLKNGNLPDMPLGTYVVKGVEVDAGGGQRALLIRTEYAKYGDSKVVDFAPGSSTGAWPVNVGFTRAVE